MKYIEKRWVRIVLSLVLGGMITEILHITTGDPNRPREFNPTLFFALIIFILLSFFKKKT
ncbi:MULTISPECIES: hypothetical protein [unclassified Tenacibaculum]|uniref:hypothetical protein n=1 Tax=unclassified Tenacibaculum TaxID=2635139 RepID=UPI001F2D3994|nr:MULTISPECIES: hypothetical protein [unclassified Tenacibaculum]MCF2874057.1 hypothetical protein [Tenacibaculum sp. Cn5-1]MCF2934638.1 hypothetical protein [Tenacibaculum sp. Cn5-34]MCG7510848.1 hypothetical protein [Tenacibaculum sp. Cn5-46]